MDIFGIGPLELLLIFIIALIVMGPNDMAKAGRTIGRTLRKMAMSPTWLAIRAFMKEMSVMPNRLMRDAQLDEVMSEVSEKIKQPVAEISAAAKETSRQLDLSAWASPDLNSRKNPDDFERRNIAPQIKREDAESQNDESLDQAQEESDA